MRLNYQWSSYGFDDEEPLQCLSVFLFHTNFDCNRIGAVTALAEGVTIGGAVLSLDWGLQASLAIRFLIGGVVRVLQANWLTGLYRLRNCPISLYSYNTTCACNVGQVVAVFKAECTPDSNTFGGGRRHRFRHSNTKIQPRWQHLAMGW